MAGQILDAPSSRKCLPQLLWVGVCQLRPHLGSMSCQLMPLVTLVSGPVLAGPGLAIWSWPLTHAFVPSLTGLAGCLLPTQHSGLPSQEGAGSWAFSTGRGREPTVLPPSHVGPVAKSQDSRPSDSCAQIPTSPPQPGSQAMPGSSGVWRARRRPGS